MAKKGQSLEELEEELARLESELEAIEKGLELPTSKRKKAEKAPAAPEPADAPAPEAAEDGKKAGKSRLKMPFGRKRKDAGDAPAEAAPAEEAPAAKTEGKGRLLGKLKRKALKDDAPEAPAEAPAPGAEPAEAAPEAPAPEAAPEPAAPAEPASDDGAWRFEDGAWVRAARDAEPAKVRRVLDADGNVVEEGAPSQEDLDAVRGTSDEAPSRKVLGFLKRRSG